MTTHFKLGSLNYDRISKFRFQFWILLIKKIITMEISYLWKIDIDILNQTIIILLKKPLVCNDYQLTNK